MGRTKESDYPVWVCQNCGEAYGDWYKKGNYIGPPNFLSTFHMGTCDVCGTTETIVTEPRDYGHLRPTWKEEYARSIESQ
jgi:hypothetical protein